MNMNFKNNFTLLINLTKNLFNLRSSDYKPHHDFSLPKDFAIPQVPFLNDILELRQKIKNTLKIDKKKDEETFKQSEHLRGLVNIASTCYMNSTIQCFAHIPELYEYFKKPKTIQLMAQPDNKEKFFTVFGELIICLWNPYDTSPLYPYIFKEKLGNLNPLI